MEERFLFWEHEANRAARKGKWKLVSSGSSEYPFISDWELYDMEEDRSEINNLVNEYPQLVSELSEAWERWAESHMVYPLDGRDWDSRLKEPVFQRPE
jgi:arylsulfatase